MTELKKKLLEEMPLRKYWLSDNIRSIIALSFIWFTLYVFRLVLIKEIKTTETTTITIINSVTNILMLIIGYYFGASKIDKSKDEKPKDEQTTGG